MTNSPKEKAFSRYEAFIVAIIAFIQFTVILDFMVLSPLSAQLLQELHITTAQFGIVVSAYAFSAGLSGLLAAGFADRFDRKKMLLFFYAGFIGGTVLCGLAADYYALLFARIITGIFGGVISSVTFAIITDLFRMEVRGRVMGFVQSAFAGSQVLGLPLGLYMARHLGWHSPFMLIAGVSLLVGVGIVTYMKPVDAHLKLKSERNAFAHLFKTVSNTRYLKVFAATTLLATGGFMLMPFGSAFSTNNLGLTLDDLPILYLVTGIFSMAAGPLVGKMSDRLGKYPVFCFGSLLSILMVCIYCNLGITPLWVVIGLNVILFLGISSRIISASALNSAIPQPQDRGAFMSISSSVQQLSGGIAAGIAGLIVVQTPSGKLEHYDTLCYVVSGAILITMLLMYTINRMVQEANKSSEPRV